MCVWGGYGNYVSYFKRQGHLFSSISCSVNPIHLWPVCTGIKWCDFPHSPRIYVKYYTCNAVRLVVAIAIWSGAVHRTLRCNAGIYSQFADLERSRKNSDVWSYVAKLEPKNWEISNLCSLHAHICGRWRCLVAVNRTFKCTGFALSTCIAVLNGNRNTDYRVVGVIATGSFHRSCLLLYIFRLFVALRMFQNCIFGLYAHSENLIPYWRRYKLHRYRFSAQKITFRLS